MGILTSLEASRGPDFETLLAVVEGYIASTGHECDAEVAHEINESKYLFPGNPDSIQHFSPVIFRNLRCRAEGITNAWARALADYNIRKPSTLQAQKMKNAFERQIKELHISHRTNVNLFTTNKFACVWPDEVIQGHIERVDKPMRGTFAGLISGGSNPYFEEPGQVEKSPGKGSDYKKAAFTIVLTALAALGGGIIQNERVTRKNQAEERRYNAQQELAKTLVPMIQNCMLETDNSLEHEADIRNWVSGIDRSCSLLTGEKKVEYEARIGAAFSLEMASAFDEIRNQLEDLRFT